MCNFSLAAVEIHSNAFIVGRGCGKLAETEVCGVCVCQVGELLGCEWKSLQGSAREAGQLYD